MHAHTFPHDRRLAMALIIVGATLQTSAYTLAHLIVGRVITGLGTGIDSSTVPMYVQDDSFVVVDKCSLQRPLGISLSCPGRKAEVRYLNDFYKAC